MNKNTYDTLFLDDCDLPENECGSYEDFKILVAIDIYTQIVHRNIFEKTLKKLAFKKYDINLSNITYNKKTKSHEYKLPNGDIITFDMLSEHIEDADKTIIKELESRERKGKCHDKSMELGLAIR